MTLTRSAAAEEHMRLHQELHEELYNSKKRKSKSQPARTRVSSLEQAHATLEEEATVEDDFALDERDTFDRAEKLTILVAFSLMIYSFYIVVSLTPSTIGSFLGGGAILMAICSGVNIVSRGKI